MLRIEESSSPDAWRLPFRGDSRPARQPFGGGPRFYGSLPDSCLFERDCSKRGATTTPSGLMRQGDWRRLTSLGMFTILPAHTANLPHGCRRGSFMAMELEHLISKINQEGIDKGEKAAAEILARAKERAAAIVAEAEAAAKAHMEKAERDSQVYVERSARSLEQAVETC